MEVVLAEVLPVGNNTDDPLPTLVHNGTKYVVAQPGTEWELRGNILNAKIDQSYRVWVELDRKSIGYSWISHCEGFRQDRSVVFHGFAHTDPYTGKVADRAFKFGALRPAAHAATVQHPDQIQAGRIEVTCEAVVRSGKHNDAPSSIKWATDAASKKLPEDKKWFLQPGLQAEEGSTVKQSDNGWDNHT
ncbi:hypothetical protein OEZ85_007885 [Tetradesmus obliquus]|uniref:DUF7918 domain-containing protein n=1 Tax=Tetradesmus obliquus TaxID=3088 RepID=A0ABY8TLU3_TETOB|nr:hypothetical protein OEZ85_007885 [Tetradesmus obliquus]